MVNCPRCNRALQHDDRWCSGCGFELTPTLTPTPTPRPTPGPGPGPGPGPLAYPYPNSGAPPRSNAAKVLAIVLAACVLVPVLIVGVAVAGIAVFSSTSATVDVSSGSGAASGTTMDPATAPSATSRTDSSRVAITTAPPPPPTEPPGPWTAPDGSFTITFPDEPEVKADANNDPSISRGQTATAYDEGAYYTVTWTDLKPGYTYNEPRNRLLLYAQAMASNTGGILSRTQESTFAGLPAVAIWIDYPKERSEARAFAFMSTTRSYGLLVKAGESTPYDFQGFLNSFHAR